MSSVRPLGRNNCDGFELAIIKLTAFCDLNCTYCYMFNQADRTFQRVPKQMPLQTALRFLERVETDLQRRQKSTFHITLHGGEPTLWPLRSFAAFLDAVERLRSRRVQLTVSMQTNAYRYDAELLKLLAAHRVTLGVSLDGPKGVNDRTRIGHRGLGSYDRVICNVNRMLDSGYQNTVKGFLSVAQPSVAPEEYLNWANDLPIRRLDVLWPMEFHYGNLPWKHSSPDDYADAPVYGSWFASLFDEWWRRDDPTLYIRFFYDCLAVLLGSTHHVENIVNDTVPLLVVNTDGQYEYHDYLRSYQDGACSTGLSVDTASLADVLQDEVVQFLLHLDEHLPPECRDCSVRKLCGGGFLPGRTTPGRRMPDRRSILCLDQHRFFASLYGRLGRMSDIRAYEREHQALRRAFAGRSSEEYIPHASRH